MIDSDLEKKLTVNYKFEIKNGLLGIERDRFLLLLGYSNLIHSDIITRNV
jgi:hypothetical protein